MADEEEKAALGGVESPDYLRPIYANFVNVNHTPWDFRLVFAVLTTPMPGPEREGMGTELHPHASQTSSFPQTSCTV
jgi:hypothetical protein